MNEVAAKSALSVAEQSVLGALLIVAVVALAALITYILKDKKSSEKTTTDGMKEVLQNINAFLKAQSERDVVLLKTIDHERGRSKECYEEIVERLEDHHNSTLAAITALGHLIELKLKG